MSRSVPHIVQYPGSKRKLAPQILFFMPSHFKRLVEPFAGMAAVSTAAAGQRADSFYLNGLNEPLVNLLQEAVNHPERLLDGYAAVWDEQFARGDDQVKHFYAVRDRFNAGEKTPASLLYLLARCVKGSVRYGKDGKFNQSPDKEDTEQILLIYNETFLPSRTCGRENHSLPPLIAGRFLTG